MEDGKNAKNYYVGKIMPRKFFQVSLKNLSIMQALESAKPPKKNALAVSAAPMALNILKSNLNKFTRLFQILSAIFNNILCLVMSLFVPKILNTMMYLIFLFYSRPMYPDKHGDTQFCPLLDCFAKLKN